MVKCLMDICHLSYPRMRNTVGATNVEQMLKPNSKNLFKMQAFNIAE